MAQTCHVVDALLSCTMPHARLAAEPARRRQSTRMQFVVYKPRMCQLLLLRGFHNAVKLSQRKQLVDKDGKNWHDWVQAQPAGKKLSDPRRYTPEQLADFLASLKSQKPDPRAPGKELVKPQKLLKRYLPWLHARIQVSSRGQASATMGIVLTACIVRLKWSKL